ncbi:RHS repeat-associated core domain-containing protein [Pasteurella sp. PK-2025]|uniref:RHS repeat-associated core domain-containing protein n=1 Tax=Pasteurella sp. PK-2025 TaxID=3413133 RepID=UPI003C738343
MWYYQYDALGRRISKACPQQQLRITYLWDGDQLAYTQTVKQDKLISQRHSVFHGWQLIAQQNCYQQSQQTLDGNKTEWKHETHYAITQPNGKVLGLLSPEGKLKWKDEKRSVWGLLFPNDYRKTSPLDPQLLFAGQYTDPESGLAYNRFRYYDPESGNYISSDPIGLNGGEQPYRYTQNTMDWVDVLGLARCHGLPSTRKAGGTGKTYDPINGQGLYVLRDPITNQIKYVGRGDAYARGIAHKLSTDKKHLIQDILSPNNLTKEEAKYLEQRLMDYFGGAQSTNPMTNLMNKIRSYSQANPNARYYDIAGDSFGWGKKYYPIL